MEAFRLCSQLAALALCLVTQTIAGEDVKPPRIPMIATGWDSPSPARFRAELAAFEKWGIFDGTVILPTRCGSKGNQEPAYYAFSRDPWSWDNFTAPLADLKNANPVNCRENFLALWANPGDVDWFDDAGWKEITTHWRLLARLAKQGGLRGILYDAEPYEKPYEQFRYTKQSARTKHTFSEYRSKARERGREVMTAVTEEFPDAVIFTYRLFSDMLLELSSGDLNAALAASTTGGAVYGLQPAFIDGWLDVMPKEMQVIEGAEEIGYHANSAEVYRSGYARLRLRMPEFLAPEHREKVNRQFRVAQSAYLDNYLNPSGEIDSRGTTPAARLASNVRSAFDATDRLVWIYSEKGRWWSGGNQEHPLWPEKLKQCDEALRAARDSEAFAREIFSRTPAPLNLLQNTTFDTEGKQTTHWWTWQNEGSNGRFSFDESAVKITNVSGVMGQALPAKPRELFAVSVNVAVDEGSFPYLQIGWKDEHDAWVANANNRMFRRVTANGAGVRRIEDLVEVPPNVTQLVFMIGSDTGTESATSTFSAPIAVRVLTK